MCVFKSDIAMGRSEKYVDEGVREAKSLSAICIQGMHVN